MTMQRTTPPLLAMGLVLIISIIAAPFIAENVREHEIESKTEGYLAQGTIPADAKLYPVLDEEIPMLTLDEEGHLSQEDIWTLTRYTDLFASLDDTNGNGYDADNFGFLTTTTVKEIEQKNRDNENSYCVDGTQVLSIYVDDGNHVEVIYLSRLTGSSAELEQGTYDVLASLFFKKVNQTWYEDGIGHYITAPTGDYTYDRDPITGQITVNPVS